MRVPPTVDARPDGVGRHLDLPLPLAANRLAAMHKSGQRRRSKFRNLGLWIWVLLAILVVLGTVSRIVNGPRELPAPDQLSMAVSVVVA